MGSSKDKADKPRDFVRKLIDKDLAEGRHDEIVTRFPPEPNGYLHIGHAKSICLNFGVAGEFGGRCHLRFDDTNPSAEDTEYVDSIKADIAWLGFDWGQHLYFASDYYQRLYDCAEELVRRGRAYVCELSAEQVREQRGTLTRPGSDSPWRERSAEESLDLFRRMRAGEFEAGSHTLRARIDMASPRIVMRDPVLYRIQRATHHRTGDDWCVYPMYDLAHCLSDSFEGITHSLCTLEFADNKALYDWVLDALDSECHPQQIEFARLNLTHTVMSKRVLRGLVEEGKVSGWDDPRMPTLSGMRRRGYPPAAIRNFCLGVGVTRSDNTVQYEQLEHELRQELNSSATRLMGVLDPLKLTITNWPEGKIEQLTAINNPEDESAGTREVPFSGSLYVEREDFMEDPPRKFFRLSPGREVRLRYAYFVTCNEVVKNDEGEVIELLCSYDPATRGGDSPDGRKVKATLHWVSAEQSVPARVRLYDRLFTAENPLAEVADSGEDGNNIGDAINPDSLRELSQSRLEPSAADLKAGVTCQFERKGYFCLDPDSTADLPVFNRTVTLRDAWARLRK